MASLRHDQRATSGAYLERPDRSATPLDRFGTMFGLSCRKAQSRRSQKRFLAHVGTAGSRYRERSTAAITADLEQLRRRLGSHGLRPDLTAESFAIVRELADRTIGQRPYDVQVIGGRALLQGFACEMQTGEGKTLAATLPACTAALAGRRVHIVTVNDYLARRDAETMAPIYEAMGIEVGVVTHGQSPSERRHAYSRSVTYCTNKELVFDYLRDRLTLGDRDSRLHLLLEQLGAGPHRVDELLLRGLDYAIVDELDSVLVDEARTPLVLSKVDEHDGNPYAFQWARSMAEALQPQEHFVANAGRERIDLTECGRSELRRLAQEGSAIDETWRFAREREERIVQALTARYLFRKDRDYIVRDGKIEIVDRNTGRACRTVHGNAGCTKRSKRRKSAPPPPAKLRSRA